MDVPTAVTLLPGVRPWRLRVVLILRAALRKLYKVLWRKRDDPAPQGVGGCAASGQRGGGESSGDDASEAGEEPLQRLCESRIALVRGSKAVSPVYARCFSPVYARCFIGVCEVFHRCMRGVSHCGCGFIIASSRV